jgi:hypothetical protein
MPKDQINFRASETTSRQLNQLQSWLEFNQTEVIARAAAELYEKELARRRRDLTDKINQFARTFADKGELTDEERGYARAMLEVIGVLDLEVEDLNDALLDHIEYNKL